MPPTKRPAAAGAMTSTSKRKKVSIGGTSIIGGPDAVETHASGRPKRSSIGEPTYNPTPATKSALKTAQPAATHSPSPPTTAPQTRGRGRPRKDTTAPKGEQQAAATRAKSPSKPVGRPTKSTKAKSPSPAPTARQARNKTARSPKSGAAPPTTKPRGTPKRTTPKAAAAAPPAARADEPPDTSRRTTATETSAAPRAESQEKRDGLTANKSDGDEGHAEDEKQYWLMKAEPESRLENGVDVKFSIDDLMKANEPEGWDGVRNPVARNRMRAMRKGDRAFFYHSNTKVPGVAGIMEIVKEHTIDESAFNPASPYYDPKSSRDKPKWELVHVRFVRKLSQLIPLSELRKHGQSGGALQDLEMLKQSRLSVSAVRPREWHFILGLASDDRRQEEPGES